MSENLVDTDSEDELPPGWEERLANNGIIYYVNHVRQETQWEHPKTGLTKKLSKEMPYGWTKTVCQLTGKDIFVNSKDNSRTEIDPRRAFPVYEVNASNVDKVGRIWQRFDSSSTALHVVQGRDLTGFNAVITGANSGIGYETARSLASVGANVILACRHVKKANEAVKAINREYPAASVQAIMLDLARLNTVDQFVCAYEQMYNKVNILILNAGIFWCEYEKTADGFEKTFQTNYLGHFYLIKKLKHLLFSSTPSRIIFVSAESHRFTDLKYETICEGLLSPPSPQMYHPILSYNLSKMCLVLLANELHRRWFNYGVQCFSVHPGNMVYTNLGRGHWLLRILFFLTSPFSKTAQQGAACSVFCATARELEGLGGKYFVNCFETEPSLESLNQETSSMLWLISKNMVGKAATLREDSLFCKPSGEVSPGPFSNV